MEMKIGEWRLGYETERAERNILFHFEGPEV